MKYSFRTGYFNNGAVSALRVDTSNQSYLLSELFQTPFSNDFKQYQFTMGVIKSNGYDDLKYIDDIDYTAYHEYGIVGVICFENDIIKLIDWREYEEGKPYNGPVIILTGEELEKIFKHYLSILYLGVENNRYKIDETEVFDTDDDNPAYKLTEAELEDIYRKHKKSNNSRTSKWRSLFKKS